MKLRSLYSNDDQRLPRIEFRDGLSVLFARVRDPDVQSHDSHNLGKTFLIRVLDFVLLGGCEQKHPFKIRGHPFQPILRGPLRRRTKKARSGSSR